MPLELSVQFDIILYSFLSGLLTGILFDAYRIVRGFRCSKIVMIIEDILFWILCALIVFAFLLYTNYAFLGVYVYLFVFIAITLYFKTLSKYIINSEKSILKKLFKLCRITKNNFIYPFKIFFSKISDKNK
ncbi:MAG: spore cortex biosynthesis protein YabQ [Clostridium sp.]|nr:spore cortex biosynthesis protein YabQ [Clostridium sp.]